MALDVASLTLDDSQASLASMPEELWRTTSRPGRFSAAVASRPPMPRQTSPRVGLRHMRGTLCKSILNDPKHRVTRPRTSGSKTLGIPAKIVDRPHPSDSVHTALNVPRAAVFHCKPSALRLRQG